MAKRLKASSKASPSKSERPSRKLSLYPLDLGTALGAALKAGPVPQNKNDKKHRKNKTY